MRDIPLVINRINKNKMTKETYKKGMNSVLLIKELEFAIKNLSEKEDVRTCFNYLHPGTYSQKEIHKAISYVLQQRLEQERESFKQL